MSARDPGLTAATRIRDDTTHRPITGEHITQPATDADAVARLYDALARRDIPAALATVAHA